MPPEVKYPEFREELLDVLRRIAEDADRQARHSSDAGGDTATEDEDFFQYVLGFLFDDAAFGEIDHVGGMLRDKAELDAVMKVVRPLRKLHKDCSGSLSYQQFRHSSAWKEIVDAGKEALSILET